MFSGLQDISSGQENSPGTFGHVPFSAFSRNLGSKFVPGQANSEAIGSSYLNPPRKFTYAERISTSAALGSPKTKKTGSETREELQNSLLARSDTTHAVESGFPPSVNVCIIYLLFICIFKFRILIEVFLEPRDP